MAPRISVVIPTLNEAANLSAALESVHDADERIVVDGGSTDSTRIIAENADLFITTQPGRAQQLNAGAKRANGDVLLFLHADTQLTGRAIDEIRNAMTNPSITGGAFRLRINSKSFALRIIACCVNLRSKWLRLPYGDQGIFIRRSVFESLGGYRELAIAEDADLVRRMRSKGQCVLLKNFAITSDRRWRKHGLARTTFANLTATIMWLLRMTPKRIRRFYDAVMK